jgi:biopolymer transport protein ExbB/TolQ
MNDLQQLIYDISEILLWPVLIAVVLCLLWALVELGVLLYELWLRFRYRDLDALEVRALRARKAFRDGKPRTAYRYLEENTYSVVVVRFLYDLIRNYQTERLAAKPLKLLQEYEFYTIKRLERTRILVRVGPILGLMGTLIPLAPALLDAADGDLAALTEGLVTAFSVAVLGLLIGGIAFVISIIRDRMYSQDISDMEYLLELLEGDDLRLRSGRRLSRTGVWDTEVEIDYEVTEEDAERTSIITLPETPDEPLLPVATTPVQGNGGAGRQSAVDTPAASPEKAPAGRKDGGAGLTFDDPSMDWSRDDDPFADLGPIDPEGTDDPRPRGSGGPSRRR